MEKMIAGIPVDVNPEGYLTNLEQWNKQVAEAIAAEEGVGPLQATHWKVIDWLQDQHRNKVTLSMRKVGTSGVTDIKEFYALFPGGPLKKATKIAGIPKPVSCV